MPSTTEERVQQQLQQLVGLDLTATTRAVDMRCFDYGELRPYGKGMVGELALHVQCPWRLDGPEGIVSGRADLWHPAEVGTPYDWETWDFDREPNLQDRRIAEWLGEPVPGRVAQPAAGRPPLTVLAVRALAFGGAEIDLAGGYRLTLFPGGSAGEDWRLFRPNDHSSHFVVSAGRIEDE